MKMKANTFIGKLNNTGQIQGNILLNTMKI